MNRNYFNTLAAAMLLLILGSCKKESDLVLTENNEVQPNLATQSNATYGNWLSFDNRAEFIAYAQNIQEVFASQSNSDSILNLLDNSNGIISMRQFYSDTTDFNFPQHYDSVEFVHGTMAAVVNKHAIYQVGDTIIRIGKNYLFAITDGDVNALSVTDALFASSNINENTLPNNVFVRKIERGGTMEEIEQAGNGYNVSFTHESMISISSKVRYKLVAGYICYSYPFPTSMTEYYTTSEYEKGARSNRGVWKWTTDWAVPLVLNSRNDFNVKVGQSVRNFKKGANWSSHGKRETLFDYYWWDPAPFVTYFIPIDMWSFHKSVRQEGTREISIIKP